MKRSLSKRASLILWFAGSCGAVLWTVLWTCFGIFNFIYKRPTRPVVIILFIAVGIWAAREGFKTFKAERNSN